MTKDLGRKLMSKIILYYIVFTTFLSTPIFAGGEINYEKIFPRCHKEAIRLCSHVYGAEKMKDCLKSKRAEVTSSSCLQFLDEKGLFDRQGSLGVKK